MIQSHVIITTAVIVLCSHDGHQRHCSISPSLPPPLCSRVADEVTVLPVMSCLFLPTDLIPTRLTDRKCCSRSECNASGKERGAVFAASERRFGLLMERKQ